MENVLKVFLSLSFSLSLTSLIDRTLIKSECQLKLKLYKLDVQKVHVLTKLKVQTSAENKI